MKQRLAEGEGEDRRGGGPSRSRGGRQAARGDERREVTSAETTKPSAAAGTLRRRGEKDQPLAFRTGPHKEASSDEDWNEMYHSHRVTSTGELYGTGGSVHAAPEGSFSTVDFLTVVC